MKAKLIGLLKLFISVQVAKKGLSALVRYNSSFLEQLDIVQDQDISKAYVMLYVIHSSRMSS